MIITCQACTKRYVVDAHAIGKTGRVVRCTTCGHSWRQVAIQKNVPEILNERELSLAQESKPPQLRAKGFKLRGWAVFSLVVLGVLAIGVFSREPVAKKWPRLAPMYARLGLPVELAGSGLSLQETQVIPLESGGKKMLMVKGSVYNSSDQMRYIPPLNIRMWGECKKLSWWKRIYSYFTSGGQADPQRCVVKFWQHSHSQSRLFPGEHSHFETASREIPGEVSDITVSF